MPDVQGFLTRKAGPLPVWGWAAIAGGLTAVLYLRGKGQSSGSPAGAAPTTDSSGQGLFAPSPIIVTPTTMVSSSNSTPPSQAAPGTVGHTKTAPAGFPQSGQGAIPIYASPASQAIVGWASFDTDLPILGPAIAGRSTGGQFGTTSWYPITWGGSTGYVSAQDFISFSGGATGMGGAGQAVKTMPGAGRVGRFTSRHAHPQFLSLGGMGGGPSALKAVAKRTGLPEERLMALNPGHWRPTPGGPPRHIQIR